MPTPQYEDVYEPPMLDSTGQAILQAIQALSAPSATNVAVDATGMDIITAENAQGALKQLDSAVDSVNASLAQLETQVSSAKFGIDTGNKTSFTFSGLHNLSNTGIYKHGLIIVGTSTTSISCYVVFVNADNTSVVFYNLGGVNVRTFTGSVSGDSLTITSDSTCYGGLKLIWLT